MKHINYFKKETEKHRSSMARRQQAWDWLRKMKKEHNYTKKQFVKELHHMGLVRHKKRGRQKELKRAIEERNNQRAPYNSF